MLNSGSFDCCGFNCKVIYARRRSMCVSISDDNSVTVRCPLGTSRARIVSFLQEKLKWIERNMARNRAVGQEFGEVTAMKKILVEGRFYELFLGGEDGISDCCVSAKDLKNLKKIYVDCFGGRFIARFKEFAGVFGFKYNKVSFRTYRGRWGCCDGANNIAFNYKLLMLPHNLQDCVIAHELCHTVHHDHSPAFHALLDRVYPSNRADERQLKRYSFIARMY